MSTVVSKAEARLAVVAAQNTSRTAALISGAAQILAVIVGFGILKSAESGAILNGVIAIVNAGSYVVYLKHTGKISPSAVETHLLALIVAGAAIGVSFSIWSASTVHIVVGAVTAVGAALVQILHAYLSQTVPTPTPAPAPRAAKGA